MALTYGHFYLTPLPPGEGRVRESNKDNVLILYPLILAFSLREKGEGRRNY